VISTVFLSFLLLADPGREAFEHALRSLSSGDLAAAEHGFQRVLSAAPNHVGALGNLGVVYMRMDRPGEAIQVYRRALKLAPADPLLNLNLGLAYMKQDDYQAARPAFEKVLAVTPDHGQARELLAMTHLFTGAVDEAVRYFERGSSPDNLYFLALGYLKQGRKEEARRTIEQMFEALDPARANFLVGRAYYESTLFDEAAAALEAARKIDRSLPGIHRELGKAYVSLRRSEDARKSLEEALLAAPSDHEARYFLGALLVQIGELNTAVEHLEKARAARPEFWGNYYYLGRAMLEMDDAPAAIRLLERAAALNGEEASVFYQLSRAYRAGGRAADSRRAAERMKTLRERSRIDLTAPR
jgi:tetratricopeptide (TPR) repeat protein